MTSSQIESLIVEVVKAKQFCKRLQACTLDEAGRVNRMQLSQILDTLNNRLAEGLIRTEGTEG